MRRGTRGFTLTEVSTVVLLLSILAVIAVVTYSRHKHAARLSEATQMTGAIRTAQQSFFAENGVYANVSQDKQSYYPAAKPGRFATSWGGACATCVSPNAWERLAVRPNAPVVFGYATIAGVGADATAIPVSGSGGSGQLGVPGHAMGSSGGMGGLGPSDPFFISIAYGDLDGDGNPTRVVGYSTSSTPVVMEGP